MAKKIESRVGRSWRVLAWKNNQKAVDIRFVGEQNVDFDELVIDDFLHIEKMNSRAYWARIGDARLWIYKNRKGETKLTIERNQY